MKEYSPIPSAIIPTTSTVYIHLVQKHHMVYRQHYMVYRQHWYRVVQRGMTAWYRLLEVSEVAELGIIGIEAYEVLLVQRYHWQRGVSCSRGITGIGITAWYRGTCIEVLLSLHGIEVSLVQRQQRYYWYYLYTMQ